MNTRRLLIVVLLAVAVMFSARPQSACGPFLPGAIFSYSMHPDLPLDKFAAGQLGVLRPEYARSYLTVAYRYLNGGSFDREEQKALTELWSERLDLDTATTDTAPAGGSWTDARKQVANVSSPEKLDFFRPINPAEPYQTYLNCPDPSFKTAAKTLSRLIASYGAASKEVSDWTAAQDQVFSNCGGGQRIPPELPAAAPAALRAERAYQIAAANFYSGNFDASEKAFTAIAADNSSPWRTIAPYLAARALVRRATLSAKEGEVNVDLLTQAETRLRSLLADQSRSDIHQPARALLRFVLERTKPDLVLHELAGALLKKNSGNTVQEDLWDYTWLLDKLLGDNEDEKKKFETLSKVKREDDLTDWVLVFQVDDRQALEYAIQKWSRTNSLPWLVAAISKADGRHAKTPALLDAAAKVRRDSPAFATVGYHSLRLLIELNRKDEARKQLDDLLGAKTSQLPPSARNEFLALRMKLAGSLDEFLKYAQRVPAAISYNEDGRELPGDISSDAQLKALAKGRVCFDADAAWVLNYRLPVAMLRDASASTTLAAHLRRQIALAAWTRAVLLDDEQTAVSLAAALQTLAPELKEQMSGYAAAVPGEARKYAGLILMLRLPGFSPTLEAGVGRLENVSKLSDFRDNWWCAAELKEQNRTTPRTVALSYTPEFLSDAQAKAAAAESAKLFALGTAPNYLCTEAMKWANAAPDDPRVPEALHLAVRATRFGCTDDQTGKFSKQAFDLLHRKYPRSSWTQQTKYWFKG